MDRNQNKKKYTTPGQPKQSRWVGWLNGISLFVLGALMGPILYQLFVERLPGPSVEAQVMGLRPMSGNGIGCTYYTLMLVTDDPIDHVYVKVQFPTQIENIIVGLPVEAKTSGTGRIAMQAWEGGKNAKGECAVIQAAVNNNADVQSSAAGNMISVHASKLPPETRIFGMVATTNNKSSVKPAPTKLYTEGAYEYVMVGQTIRKPLRIIDRGITDAK
jgi:hypothetical protein